MTIPLTGGIRQRFRRVAKRGHIFVSPEPPESGVLAELRIHFRAQGYGMRPAEVR